MKLFLIIVLLSGTFCIHAQVTPAIHNLPHIQNVTSTKDTTIESDTSKENKEPRYYYLTLGTNIFVNTTGGFAERFSPSIEYGRTYGIFDVGLAAGLFNALSKGRDTTVFLEFRPTINVFSKGRFAEGLTLGMGYVFNARQGLMTEICNSINFNITETIEIAVIQGYYFFDGVKSNRNAQYMGFTYTYNFLKRHSVNKQRKRAAIISDN